MKWVSLSLGLLVVALVLRWPLASHDVQHYIGPDEGEVVENVLEMLKTGDLDHRHRGYPGLHFYLQMGPAAAHRWLQGGSISELPRSGFYLTARRVTLVAGILSSVVVFLAGRIYLSFPASLVAAGLVALSPLASRESAVVNPDLMLMLFVAAALYCCLRLVTDRRLAAFILAGVTVGLATSIKYTGGFTAMPYAAACLFGSHPGRHGLKAASGAFAAVAAFALASPYTLLHFDTTLAGLATHASYYNARQMNGALELGRVLLSRGLGVAAGLGAVVGFVVALGSREPRRLVLVSFPLVYFVVFAFFGRAFPRHALVLIGPLALLAADMLEVLSRRASARVVVACSALLLAAPLWGSVTLVARAARPTPAERAGSWARQQLPPGSRVLQDQFTPDLEGGGFRTHRLRVEERVFVGNYDWAFVSGYPPGIDAADLREVQRFETGDALGGAIVVYQVPPRESLMPVTLALHDEASAGFGAGELPFFGDGWHPPRSGAYETSRLSTGSSSEIFFVLPRNVVLSDLEVALTLGPAVPRSETRVRLELNGESVATASIGPADRGVMRIELGARELSGGINRLVLHYPVTERLDRRRRETAIRLYRLALTWKNPARLR